MPSFSDDLTKHQIFLQRYAAGMAKSLKVHLSNVYTYIEESLVTRSGVDRKEIVNVLNPIKREAIGKLSELAEYEHNVINKLLKRHYSVTPVVVEPQKLQKAILSPISIVSTKKKKSLENVWSQYIDNKSDEFDRVIKDVTVQQEPKDKILTASNLLIAGLMFTQLRSLTNTSVNHTTSKVRQWTYRENNIPLLKWVSILDSDTCEDCEELDGTEWPADEAEIPPEHWNCRCQLEPADEI